MMVARRGCRVDGLLRHIRARRLSLRARLRSRAAAYLGICHEAAEGALEEERGHWGRSQNQGGEDQAHAALLHGLAARGDADHVSRRANRKMVYLIARCVAATDEGRYDAAPVSHLSEYQ